MEGKVYVITGAYGGFGEALAELLADRKAKLVITGRDESKLNPLAEKLKKKTDVFAVKADVTKVRDCKRIIDTCIKEYGRLDVMINNAGVLEDGTEPKLVDKLIDTNLKGLEYCSYYATNQMQKQKDGGVLVNIGSTSGVKIKPMVNEAIYISSKFGVVAYSGSLALAYKDGKIKVLCFCPGGMKTELFRHDPSRLGSDFMDPAAAAAVLVQQLDAERYGLFVLLRAGKLQYSKDFSLAWNWDFEENIDLKEVS